MARRPKRARRAESEGEEEEDSEVEDAGNGAAAGREDASDDSDEEGAAGGDSDGDSSDDDGSEEEGSDGDGDILLGAAMSDEVLEIEFEFFDPQEDDFHSARALMQQSVLVSAAGMDASALADLIVGQVAVGARRARPAGRLPCPWASTHSSASRLVVRPRAGTVLKSGGKDEAALGFLSALSLAHHGDEPCMRKLKAALEKHCPAAHRGRLAAALSAAEEPCALLVNERLINVPTELIGPLHGSLAEDLEWAVANAEPAAERAAFRVGHFVALVEAAPDPAAGGALAAVRVDDECLREKAALAFEVPCAGAAARGRGPPPRLLALLVPAAEYRALRVAVEALVAAEEDAEQGPPLAGGSARGENAGKGGKRDKGRRRGPKEAAGAASVAQATGKRPAPGVGRRR
mmetsp:Transcript_18406/g.61614  ORF Transcript_18406/g.61614 Transcript_18406/m.61614 type:complete len:405 (+) Transcript_18406:13-1227(+)